MDSIENPMKNRNLVWGGAGYGVTPFPYIRLRLLIEQIFSHTERGLFGKFWRGLMESTGQGCSVSVTAFALFLQKPDSFLVFSERLFFLSLFR